MAHKKDTQFIIERHSILKLNEYFRNHIYPVNITQKEVLSGSSNPSHEFH